MEGGHCARAPQGNRAPEDGCLEAGGVRSLCARTFPGSPDTTRVRAVSDTSTTRARKICASCKTSVRWGPGGARSFMIIISRSAGGQKVGEGDQVSAGRVRCAQRALVCAKAI